MVFTFHFRHPCLRFVDICCNHLPAITSFCFINLISYNKFRNLRHFNRRKRRRSHGKWMWCLRWGHYTNSDVWATAIRQFNVTVFIKDRQAKAKRVNAYRHKTIPTTHIVHVVHKIRNTKIVSSERTCSVFPVQCPAYNVRVFTMLSNTMHTGTQPQCTHYQRKNEREKKKRKQKPKRTGTQNTM